MQDFPCAAEKYKSSYKRSKFAQLLQSFTYTLFVLSVYHHIYCTLRIYSFIMVYISVSTTLLFAASLSQIVAAHPQSVTTIEVRQFLHLLLTENREAKSVLILKSTAKSNLPPRTAQNRETTQLRLTLLVKSRQL
jgi:hypothetical protein